MSQNLEIEFKNSLTKTEYEKIIDHFNPLPESMIKQVNIYFDTKDLILKKQKTALRARIKKQTIELTLKQKQKVGILETTDIITENDLSDIIQHHKLNKGEVFNKLQELEINDALYELASLTTYRYEIPYLGNLIAIDKSFYYNHWDYEIELETNEYNNGKKIFQELLASFKIPRIKTKNKIVRAYNYKKNL
ncbi:CYTH domain-containing protein [Mycoplasmatota bacterium]|nr:CYTH domain-containing protein [Mycoplasmatota bacterium]